MFKNKARAMKKKIKKFFLIWFLITVLVIITPILVIFNLTQPVSSSQETARFVIPRGQAISIIGNRLQEEGLIKSGLVFRGIVTVANISHDIQAGSFDLNEAMTTYEIAKHLTTGTEDTWITILEGWRLEEIAESLAAQDLDSFDKDEFTALAKSSEGMLFPDTYLIPREMSTENIHSMLLNTFERKIIQGLAEEISDSGRNFEDVLIMASLVEREARNYEQMRKVSGILWNRIDLGMALQVDATLQYVAGYDRAQQTWWAPPTSSQKKLKSSFNTYLNPGLPPQPIANPGFDAIKATLLPQESDDLFYIHANNGNIYTARTLEQHNVNINKYLR